MISYYTAPQYNYMRIKKCELTMFNLHFIYIGKILKQHYVYYEILNISNQQIIRCFKFHLLLNNIAQDVFVQGVVTIFDCYLAFILEIVSQPLYIGNCWLAFILEIVIQPLYIGNCYLAFIWEIVILPLYWKLLYNLYILEIEMQPKNEFSSVEILL